VKLLSDILIRGLRAKNRIMFCAHRTNLAGVGTPEEALFAYYAERARGGCGIIVVGEMTLHPNDRPYEKMIEVYSAPALRELGRLADTLHAEDTLVFAQLNHRGFQSHGLISRLPTWGPEALSDVVYGEVCQKMERQEIGELVNAFAHGARRLKEAGFDGVEVSIGKDSILRQFLSPLSNFRDDEYGGDPLNRLRCAMEVLSAIRDSVGADFPVGVQLCLDEMFYGALTIGDSIAAARELERRGLADYFNTTVGTYYNTYLARASMLHPPGLTLDKVEALKRAVGLPVIAGDFITIPEMAETVLMEDKADLIGLIRPLICDPQAPQKIARDDSEAIIRCVYDNQNCVGRAARNKPVGCIQNPRVGFEHSYVAPTVAGVRRRVAIVGAGPAGLKAAAVAAARGHQVTVYEREDVPGGQVRLARRAPGREEIGGVVDNLLRELVRLDAEILTGREMTAQSVLAEKPDVIIVATGSAPDPRPIPGDYSPPHVLNIRQVLEESYPVGDTAILIDQDGGFRSLPTAEFLLDQGKRVDILTGELFVGIDLATTGDLYTVRQRLLQKGARFICDQVAVRIDKRVLTALGMYTEDSIVYDGYDTIVIAMGAVAEDSLYRQLKSAGVEVYRVGDCVAPRGIGSAISEAARIAASV